MEQHSVVVEWSDSPDGVHEGWPYAKCSCGEFFTAKDPDLIEEALGQHLGCEWSFDDLPKDPNKISVSKEEQQRNRELYEKFRSGK